MVCLELSLAIDAVRRALTMLGFQCEMAKAETQLLGKVATPEFSSKCQPLGVTRVAMGIERDLDPNPEVKGGGCLLLYKDGEDCIMEDKSKVTMIDVPYNGTCSVADQK